MYNLDHKLIGVRSEDLVFHLHEYDVDLNSNHIYLMGVDRGYEVTGLDEPGIEYVIANRFIKNINLCMRTSPSKPIIIHMKTSGGFVVEGMAIYDAIKCCPSQVTILNYTHARSMSSLILQAADKRVMMPNSHFMYHEGTAIYDGTVKFVKSNIEFDRKFENVMLDIYTEQMNKKGIYKGKDTLKIKKMLRDQMDRKQDVFLTAQETVDAGLADEIFDYDWKSLSVY